MGRTICMSVSSHLPRVRTLRTSAYRLFPDECRASDFPILEQKDRAHMNNRFNYVNFAHFANQFFRPT